MLKVKKREIESGCDCWGRREYEIVYDVVDENKELIYTSKENPTKLIEYFQKLKVNSKENPTKLIEYFQKLKVKKREIESGCDCWGRREYEIVYDVVDENKELIYTSKENPTKLIEYFQKSQKHINDFTN